MKTILILEDNDERVAAFQETVPALGQDFALKVWRDAPSMMAEAHASTGPRVVLHPQRFRTRLRSQKA